MAELFCVNCCERNKFISVEKGYVRRVCAVNGHGVIIQTGKPILNGVSMEEGVVWAGFINIPNLHQGVQSAVCDTCKSNLVCDLTASFYNLTRFIDTLPSLSEDWSAMTPPTHIIWRGYAGQSDGKLKSFLLDEKRPEHDREIIVDILQKRASWLASMEKKYGKDN